MLAELGAAYAAVRTAGEIAKAVVAADKMLGEAELKLRLADMMGALADAKMAMASVQDIVDAREAEIARLNEALENKAKVVRVHSGYYEVNGQGKPTGDAYCMRCYEEERKLRHISYPKFANEDAHCPVCNRKYANTSVRRQSGE